MHFPLFIDLESRPCLVVGAGRIAAHKAELLRGFGAAVTMVAPEITGRGFEEADVEGMALVVAATDDGAVNEMVYKACMERGIPVNTVDEPSKCTFIFPAIARKGSVCVAVSTGGKSPSGARILRDRIGKLIEDGFVDAVEELGRDREEIKRRFPDIAERRRWCERRLEKWKD